MPVNKLGPDQALRSTTACCPMAGIPGEVSSVEQAKCPSQGVERFPNDAPYLGSSNFRSYASKLVRVLPYSTKSLTIAVRFLAASALDFMYCWY